MSYQSYMQQALSDIYKKKQPQGFGQPSRLIGNGYSGNRPPWVLPEGTPFNWQGGYGANTISGTGVAPAWGSFPPQRPVGQYMPTMGGYQQQQTSPYTDFSSMLGNMPFVGGGYQQQQQPSPISQALQSWQPQTHLISPSMPGTQSQRPSNPFTQLRDDMIAQSPSPISEATGGYQPSQYYEYFHSPDRWKKMIQEHEDWYRQTHGILVPYGQQQPNPLFNKGVK